MMEKILDYFFDNLAVYVVIGFLLFLVAACCASFKGHVELMNDCMADGNKEWECRMMMRGGYRR